MRCTENMCSLNCGGCCNHIGITLDEISFGPIPEPDGCLEEHDMKTSMSEE